ncbi:Glucokinase [compost metagenome]
MLGLAIFLEKGETSYTVFNCSGEVIEEGSAPSVLEEEVSSLVTYIEHIRHAHPKIHSVAIGVPGAVNNGRIFFIPSYEKYRDVDLKGVLEEQLSIPVVVENDMNAAALGYLENRKMKDSHSLIYLYLGQNGPGAGIVVNGEIVRGKTFFSGEVAFIPQYEDKSFYQALAYECKKEAAVSRSEQRIDAVARLVASMTAILNPHSFIFCADEVDPSMLHRIAERSAAYVPQEHLPELAAGDWRKDYLYGLRGLGLSLLLSHTRT